jgi:hypothetical protein
MVWIESVGKVYSVVSDVGPDVEDPAGTSRVFRDQFEFFSLIKSTPSQYALDVINFAIQKEIEFPSETRDNVQ